MPSARRPLNPATLSERIVIQTLSTSVDNQGGRSSSWSTLATVWADVRPLTARETLAAKSAASLVGYEVTTRYRSDVTPKMRITWTPSWSSGTASRTLEVHGVRVDRPTQTMALDCGEAT